MNLKKKWSKKFCIYRWTFHRSHLPLLIIPLCILLLCHPTLWLMSTFFSSVSETLRQPHQPMSPIWIERTLHGSRLHECLRFEQFHTSMHCHSWIKVHLFSICGRKEWKQVTFSIIFRSDLYPFLKSLPGKYSPKSHLLNNKYNIRPNHS